MTTFSQLIDEIVAETRRPDLLREAVRYLNQTIREIHQEPSGSNTVYYAENLREIQIQATVESGHVWDAPNPSVHQGVTAVRFDDAHRRENINYYHSTLEEDIYATHQRPGPGFGREYFAYYRGGSRYVFGGKIGYGGIGARITIAYFEFPRDLKYMPPDERPAVFDSYDGWLYTDAANVSDETRLAAREQTSNWLTLRWESTLMEGLRAKIYKRLSDTERARTSYSLYESLRRGVFTTEVVRPTGVT